MGLTERLPRRRIVNLLVAGMLIAGVVAALNSGLIACSSSKPNGSRPLKEAELNRLAAMRMHNFSDGGAGITGTIGVAGKQTAVDGWVDWRRALIYLSASTGGSTALVQARPGVVAIRPGDPAAPITGQPPKQPPADGWRVRPINLAGEQKAPLDSLLAFLFMVARDQPDRADLLAPLKNEWVRRDTTQGTEVDVLLGPAVLPIAPATATPTPSPEPTPSSSPSAKPLDPNALDSHGGAVGYWLDGGGRLRKVETLLAPSMPTAIDFLRDAKPEFTAIDALGGRDIAPREVSEPEATLLSAMRQRNYRARSAQLTITLPVLPGALRRAKGWLDWQRGISYLSVQDIDDASYDVLLHANKSSVAIHKTGGRAPDTPTIPAPKGGWEKAEWNQLSGTSGLTELDMLVYEALAMGVNQLDDAKSIRGGARRLRVDVLNGVPVGVFELPSVIEQQVSAPGQARMRYWIDNSGVLRRLEVRTGTGGLAQLDLDLGAKLPANLPSTVS